jgi:regulator of sigma E protease
VIETIDGAFPLWWADAEIQLSARVGKPVTFVVTRDGKTQTVMVTPRPAQRGTIGLMPAKFPRVTMLTDNSPAAAAGVKVGDEILAVGGQPTPLHEDVIVATAGASCQPTAYRLRRDNETLDVTITPTVRPGETRGRIGIGLEVSGDPVVGAVEPGSPAAAAKIRPGDTLTRIGSTSLKDKTWAHVQELLDDAAQKGGKIKVRRRSGAVEWPAVELAVKSEKDPLRADIGFTVEAAERKFYRYAPWRAPVVGLKKSWRVVRQGYFTVKGMVTRSLPLKSALGPVGIIRFSYAAAAEGLPKFIFWLAFLSANFAVVNLVPFPPLDGFLIVLAGVEKVRGKPVSEKFLVYFLLAGWVVILSLIVFITFHDVRR